MKHKPPYLTQGEIIRIIAKALGTKASNKKIDDYARGGDVKGYHLRSLMIDELIYDQINEPISEQLASTLQYVINHHLDSYIDLVKNIALYGLPRDKSLPLLVEHYFSYIASGFLLQFFGFDGRVISEKLIAQNVSAVASVFELIGIEHKKWGDGNILPSFNGIATLDTSQQNKSLLIIARAIDSFKRIDSRLSRIAFNSMRNHLLSTHYQYYDTGRYLSLAQIEHNKKYKNIQMSAFELFDLFSWTKNKSKDIQQKTRNMLDDLTYLAEEEDLDHLTTYFISWCEARWHLFSGRIKEANNHYNEAFNSSLYSAGENQEKILQEALIVAAKVNDKPFLKRLKNQGISFGLFGAPSDKKELVHDQEIKEWAGYFNKQFPPHILFEGVNYEDIDFNMPMIITQEDLPEPDYRNPNRVFHSIVEGKRKPIHQLTWFIMNNKPDIVKRLLKEGAKVDIESKSGETPIMMALQHMSEIENVFGVTDELFNLISEAKHNPDTLNIKTKKKGYLPILFAVESGKPEMVEKVIEMGADVNIRGTTVNKTALYHSLYLIDSIKNNKQCIQEKMNSLHYPSPEALESMRRYSSGLSGITLEHQKLALNKALNVPLSKGERIMNALVQIENEKSMKLNLDKMREIVSILVKAGADINAEHIIANQSNTPLSFAHVIGENQLLDDLASSS